MFIGEAYLGFVYQTDALSENGVVRMIGFPEGISTTTHIWITRVDDSSETNPSVSVVQQFITESLESRRIFTGHGLSFGEGSSK